MDTIQQVRTALDDASRIENGLKGDPGGTRSLTTPVVRAISRQYYKQVRSLDKDQVFHLCESLLESRLWTERTIAFDWAFRCRKHFEDADFQRFERWLQRYVDGWGSCDDLCVHAFGAFIHMYPARIAEIAAWTGSENRWLRRAAAVVLIYSIRRQENFDAAFGIADHLLHDEDDLVQKGYGWMLKEVSNHAPLSVFDYVMARKATMPRTALRYAIEKLAPALREKAMAK
jgi:3-methyladenine DNA glycosylase AlkD